MMSQQAVRLSFHPQATMLETPDGLAVMLRISMQYLAQTVMKHDPPTAIEIERVIDLIEESLRGVGTEFKASQVLMTAEPVLRSLPGLDMPGASLERDAVENMFGLLANRALGTPVSEHLLPRGKDIAAALVMLRECMHHLGFDRILVIDN